MSLEDELPRQLSDAEILALPERLFGMTMQEAEALLWNLTNVDTLYIPQTRTLLLECDGEQRRASKRKHYSMEITC
jgi:hypothetical protein